MNFDRLRHFEAVARRGSFIHAAQDLHITQPALTRSVQVLEREVGGPLFDRGRRKVELTGFGRFVLERVQILVSSHNQLSNEIEQFKGAESGHLHVGFGPLAAETLAATCISRFQREHPQITLRVSFLAVDEMVDPVISGRIEVVIGEPESERVGTDLLQVGLRRRPGYFFCRTGHPLLKKQPPALEEVVEYPFVGFKLLPPFAYLAQGGKFGTIDPVTGVTVPKVECYSVSVIKQIVAMSNGIGAATLSMISREVRDGELAPIALEIPGVETSYSIVTSRSHVLSPAAQSFIDIVHAVDAETEELLPRALGIKSRSLASMLQAKRDRVSVGSPRQRTRNGSSGASRRRSSSR